jgi:excisionase family DNA binding protein
MPAKIITMETKPSAQSIQQSTIELVEDDLLTFKEAMRLLKVSKSTLYYHVQNNRIPYMKVGRLLRFSLAALKVWMQRGVAAGQ